jgi:hypothetical protein
VAKFRNSHAARGVSLIFLLTRGDSAENRQNHPISCLRSTLVGEKYLRLKMGQVREVRETEGARELAHSPHAPRHQHFPYRAHLEPRIRGPTRY